MSDEFTVIELLGKLKFLEENNRSTVPCPACGQHYYLLAPGVKMGDPVLFTCECGHTAKVPMP